MFPLGNVIFPFSGVPLRVFEPRYQQLLDEVLDLDCSFGTVLIERGFEVGGGDVRFDVGTRLRVLAHQRLPGGHRAILVEGTQRLRVTAWLPDDPHPWADVVPLPDVPCDVAAVLAGVTSRLRMAMALASELGADTAGVDLELGDDPVAASYRAAALAPVSPLDSYALLAAPGPRERLHLVDEMLEDQIELMRLRLAGG
ncbi:MAG TPA: LON peptidase substrate-binding domain-containing protein [Acidimicrobiia bacterium]|nr:LON peptidase substrate-binding domain-containing protein [Acidimicrobiia bacterium]